MTGRAKGGEVCGSIIQAAQRANPRFRARIPLYDINGAGRFGGIVLRPSAVELKCMYGADATSWNVRGGCAASAGWCDAYVPNAARRGDPCTGAEDGYACNCCLKADCHGQQIKPWKPEHLGAFLGAYARFGGHAACCGSGYNEVVVRGGRAWNDALPAPVEAFFFEKGFPAEARRTATWLRDGFAAHHGLSPREVPLIELDRSNWGAPFAAVE